MQLSNPEGYSFFVGGDNAEDDIDIVDDSGQEVEETQEERDLLEEQQIEIDFNNRDPVQKNKFNTERQSMFLNDFPELDITEQNSETNEIKISVAPGENQIPSNILYEQGWEEKSFPGLFPDAKNSYHQSRIIPISMQHYFEQRLLNCDRRFAQTPAYLFAAFACQEKNVLERNVKLAQVRGTKNPKGGINQLNDPYRVLEASPGTPVFFRKKKQELIARLENLGPFHLFFTLSCGEKRYNENFTPFFKEIPELMDFKFRYVIEDGREKVEVNFENKWLELDDFLKNHYKTKHEFIKSHVLSQTLTFDHRVQQFIQNIMMNPCNGLPVKYYSYRVEFQLRGAAHIHGTIWVDFEKYFQHQIWEETGRQILDQKKTKSKKAKKIKAIFEQNVLIDLGNEEIINERNRRVKVMLEIFDQLRNQTFGSGEDTTEEMFAMLINFANKWISVSLKNTKTRQLCLDLQSHTCSKRYCLKCRKSCRFRYPRFPILETIVAVPAIIKYPDQEVCDKKTKLSKEILKSVKAILEKEDVMKNIVNEVAQAEIEDMLELEQNICMLEDIIEFYSMTLGQKIVTEYSQKHKVQVCDLYEFIFETAKNWPSNGFCRGVEIPESELTIEDIKTLLHVLKGMERLENHNKKKALIEKERMSILLDLAQIPGNTFDERYELYKEALSITQRGYEIVLKRILMKFIY